MSSLIRRSLSLAMVATFLSAGVAFADPGNGKTVTPFVADFGTVVCTGERIVKAGPHGSVEDKEVCVFQFPDALGLAPGKHDIFEPGIDGWFSDFDAAMTDPADPVCDPISTDAGFCFHQAISGTVKVEKSRDDTSIFRVTTFY